MTSLELAGIAAVAMVFQDVLGVMMVQSEAKQLGWTAGFLDAAGWLVAFASLRISINSHGTGEIEAIVLISIANVVGTKLGQITGKRFLEKKIRINPADPQRP